MGKRVVFNGIEILTNEGDSSAKSLLGLAESVINHLESDLDQIDENFHILINMDFSPDHPVKHSFSLTSLSNNGTRGKVLKILEKSTDSNTIKISGTVRIDLQVEDE
jgi:hypothetical protein